MKKNTVALLILAFAATFTLTACAQKSEPTAAPSPTNTPPQDTTSAPTELVSPELNQRTDSEIALAYLNSMGMTAEELKADLMSQPALIPIKGVLGGTSGFLSDETVILSESWVFARAEDGHIACSILYQYEIDSAGSISWKLVGYDAGEGFVTEPEA